MNPEYVNFFNQCIRGIGVNAETCPMENNYCRIPSGLALQAAHFEWWINVQDNALKVCLHFESSPSANLRRFNACAQDIVVLQNRITDPLSMGPRRTGSSKYHISASKSPIDLNNVDWAVNTMIIFREIFLPRLQQVL